ncbi:MAG TPA: glycine--tRNA ligase subunit beta [Fimbriimonadaceae bacterium]|nr:glycine--tRNA ligase subunit beta [Fimbriimonadaceae bacterium]
MPELLLELGCEELPASFVEKAYTDLRVSLTELLRKAGVLNGEGAAYGTPRRLIVGFSDLDYRQEDTTKEQRGPALKAAYGEDGNPTPALLGFCRSQGVDPGYLRKDEQYVWVTKTIPGRNTSDLLAEIIPQAIRGLNFEKSMRWGSSRMRFARPIRWILAAFDGDAVDFEIEGVRAGLASHGHRFYAPEEFTARKLPDLLAELRKRFVEPDAEIRREKILLGAEKVADGKPALSEALVDENVFLTEWPTALQGQYRPEFQSLPEPVLVTAMAKHEKMFPVRDDSGKLTNNFVFVRNSGEDDSVRRGNEWVLNARFNDAKFFFDEDAKHSLDEFLDRTNGIVFQEKLGSVRQRADRLSRLAEAIAEATGADSIERSFARQAALYCKADLATGLVSELASLQGIVGGEYAKREGLADPICWAIASHYDLSKNPKPDCEGARTAVRVTMADALDKLAGYLGCRMVPSGSSDPFGLRRAATTLIEAAWAWPGEMPSLWVLFQKALEGYAEQGIAVDGAAAGVDFTEVLASRYASLLPNARHDILSAALLEADSDAVSNPKAVVFRSQCLEKLADDVAFVQAATRPMNIVIAARKKGIEFGQDEPLRRLEHSALESAEGVELFELLSESEGPLAEAKRGQNVEEVLRLLKGLEGPINRFFETTMVMDDQPEVRYARLTLMHACSLALLTAGDFTRLVIEGVA